MIIGDFVCYGVPSKFWWQLDITFSAYDVIIQHANFFSYF